MAPTSSETLETSDCCASSKRGREGSQIWSGPLMIVGASRSGTELVRTILNASSRILISAETHYFDDLRPRLSGEGRPLSSVEWDVALAYFQSLSETSYGLHNPSAFHARPDPELKALAEAQGGSGDALFSAYCRRNSAMAGKAVWGDKTPRHLFRADEILEAFPDAKILVLQRDPRAVVASYRDWQNRWFQSDQADAALRSSIRREEARVHASFNLTIISLMWLSAAREAQRLLARAGPIRVRVLRFEDLVESPETHARALMEWIGLPFEPEMLTVNVVNSSYVAPNTAKGLDATVADRWREVLSADDAGYVEWLTSRTAVALGYERITGPPTALKIMRELAGVPRAMLRAVTANHRRIGDLPAFIGARLGSLLRG